MLANFLIPILEDGWRFIAIFAGLAFLGALSGLAWLFWPLLLLCRRRRGF
jgi:phosphatidylserine decarboxylase